MATYFTLSKEGKYININPINNNSVDASILNQNLRDFYSKVLKELQNQNFDFEVLCFLADNCAVDKIFVCDIINFQGKKINGKDSYSILEVFFQQYLDSIGIFKLVDEKNSIKLEVKTKTIPNFSINKVLDFDFQKFFSIKNFLNNTGQYSGDYQNAYSEIIDTLHKLYLSQNDNKIPFYERGIFQNKMNSIMKHLASANLNKSNGGKLTSLFFETVKNKGWDSETNDIFFSISKYFGLKDWENVLQASIFHTNHCYHYQDRDLFVAVADKTLTVAECYNILEENLIAQTAEDELALTLLCELSDMKNIQEDLEDVMMGHNLLIYKNIQKVEDPKELLKVARRMFEKNRKENNNDLKLYMVQALLLSIYYGDTELFFDIINYCCQANGYNNIFITKILNAIYEGDNYSYYDYSSRSYKYVGDSLIDSVFLLIDPEYLSSRNAKQSEAYKEKFHILKEKINSFIINTIKKDAEKGLALILFSHSNNLFLSDYNTYYHHIVFSQIFQEIRNDDYIKNLFIQKIDKIVEKITSPQAVGESQKIVRNSLYNLLRISGFFDDCEGKKIIYRLLDYFEKYYDRIQESNGGILAIAQNEDFIRDNKDYILELWSRFKLKFYFRHYLARSSVLPEEIYDNLAQSKSEDIRKALRAKNQMEII